MSFLILEILVLMLLAAIFGAWLAHGWVTRRYDDVTSSFNAQSVSTDGLLTKHDFDAGLATMNFDPVEDRIGRLESMIGNLHMPETDLRPIEERLMSVESLLNQPDDRIDIVGSRLSGIEGSLGDLKNTDTTRLEHQMDVIASAIAEHGATDFTPLETRISGLEDAVLGIDIPQPKDVDLGPIHSGLTRVEMSLSNMEFPATDLSGTDARIESVSQSLGMLHNTDLSHIERRLDGLDARLSSIHIPELNLTPVDEGLSAVHNRLSGIEASATDTARRLTELNALQQRLDQVHADTTRLEHIQSEIGRLEPIQSELGRLQAIQNEMTRLEHIQGEVARLEPMQSDIARLEHIQSEITRLEQMQVEIMRLERIEGTLATLRVDVQESITDTAPLEQRVDAMRADMNAQFPIDMTPVFNSVDTMERKLDLAALENRLTSIEYGLAALHHMLRTRDEEFDAIRKKERDRGFKQAAPPPPVFNGDRDDYPTDYDAPSPVEMPPRPPAFDIPAAPAPDPREYQRFEPAPRQPTSDELIGEVRKPDDRANLLLRPAFGAPDDLEDISGVGPMLHGLLTEIGVYYFWQIAEWGPAEIEWVDDMLDGFNGRIERDDWVGQAKELAAREDAAKRP